MVDDLSRDWSAVMADTKTDEARAEGFAAGLKAASDLMTQWADEADGNIEEGSSSWLNTARKIGRDVAREAAEMILRIKEGTKP